MGAELNHVLLIFRHPTFGNPEICTAAFAISEISHRREGQFVAGEALFLVV
jgi:hypothetical protein